MLVNDIHSQLNPTRVARVLKPSGLTALVDVVRAAAAAGARLSICGGRHAMGGQQYGTDTWLVDMCDHAAVHSLDEETGVLVADAGILWPDLIQGCAMLHRPAVKHGESVRNKPAQTD
ncbi:MAG: FAD-binding protein [Chthoniobacterales bacterium]